MEHILGLATKVHYTIVRAFILIIIGLVLNGCSQTITKPTTISQSDIHTVYDVPIQSLSILNNEGSIQIKSKGSSTIKNIEYNYQNNKSGTELKKEYIIENVLFIHQGVVNQERNITFGVVFASNIKKIRITFIDGSIRDCILDGNLFAVENSSNLGVASVTLETQSGYKKSVLVPSIR